LKAAESEPKNSDGPRVSITIGEIHGKIINVDGEQIIEGPVLTIIDSQLDNARQDLVSSSFVDPISQVELIKLMTDLKADLASLPKQRAEEAQLIARTVEELVKETMNSRPDKEKLRISGERLKKAAENVAAVMPNVLVIASQILSQLILFTKR